MGTLEIAAGLALVVGVVTRWAAAALTIDMLGALLTAGLADGGIHLVAPSVLAVLLVLIVVRGDYGHAQKLREPPPGSGVAGSDPPPKMTVLAEPVAIAVRSSP